MTLDELGGPLPTNPARLTRRARVDLALAMAGRSRDDVGAGYLRTLDKLTSDQLEVVELLVAVAVQNTCRVFLESAAAHDDELDEDDVCVCAGEPDGICLGVPGESDACVACLRRDPELPCLADVDGGA